LPKDIPMQNLLLDVQPARPFVSVHLVLFQEDKNKILLMKRKSGFDHDGKYVFIAGKVDHNETPIQAMVREVKEEADLYVQEKDITPVMMIYRTAVNYKNEPVDVIEIFMMARTYAGTPTIMEPDRCSEMAFYPLDEIPTNLSESVATFLIEQTANYVEVVAEKWNDYTALPFVAADCFTKSR
jgi:8-oxo-dGTP diphosphatase